MGKIEVNKNSAKQYSEEYKVIPKKDNPDYRRNYQKREHNAETDHLVPLKQIFDKVQTNAGLSDGNINDM